MVNINQSRSMYQNFAIEGGRSMNNKQEFAKVVTEVTKIQERCNQYLENKIVFAFWFFRIFLPISHII